MLGFQPAWFVHVNPQGKEKAMAFFYNPLQSDIERVIRIPLYYAGLAGTARARIGGVQSQAVSLDQQNFATLKIQIPAQSHQWVLFTTE